MSGRFNVEKGDLWTRLPMGRDLTMPDYAKDYLEREGRIMTPSDVETFQQQAHTMFGAQQYRIGRDPMWKKTRTGRQYVQNQNFRAGKFGSRPEFRNLSVPDRLYRNPDWVDRSYDYVAVIQQANQTAQDRKDMYMTGRQKQHRRKINRRSIRGY